MYNLLPRYGTSFAILCDIDGSVDLVATQLRTYILYVLPMTGDFESLFLMAPVYKLHQSWYSAIYCITVHEALLAWERVLVLSRRSPQCRPWNESPE